MPGPSANANVGVDMLGMVAEPTQALRNLRREIKAAEAELAALAAKGGKVSAQQTKVLDELRTKEVALQKIAKTKRQEMERNKRALDIGEMTKAVIGAQSIRKLLNGELDPRDAINMAVFAERQITKGVREIAGVKVARQTRGLLKALPFVGEAIASVMEGWDKKRELEKSSDEINALARAGKIPPSAARLYYASLTEGWFNDPHKTSENALNASRQLLNFNDNEMRNVLESVTIQRARLTDDSLGGVGGPSVSYETEKLSAAEVLRVYNMRLDAMRKNGEIVSKRRQEEALHDSIASLLEGDKERDQIAEKLVEQIKKKLLDKGEDNEKFVREKFKKDEELRSLQVRAARHYVPARMDY